MSSITTHVLDTARGRPAAGMRVVLEARTGDGWTAVGGGVTDADGRVPGLVAEGALRASTASPSTPATGSPPRGPRASTRW
jgi:5-hydroxyisourate hydrolase-like protein (transthyretin family)